MRVYCNKKSKLNRISTTRGKKSFSGVHKNKRLSASSRTNSNAALTGAFFNDYELSSSNSDSDSDIMNGGSPHDKKYHSTTSRKRKRDSGDEDYKTHKSTRSSKRKRRQIEKKQKEMDARDDAFEKYIQQTTKYFQQIDKHELKIVSSTSKMTENDSQGERDLSIDGSQSGNAPDEKTDVGSNVTSTAANSQGGAKDDLAPSQIAKLLKQNREEIYIRLYPRLYAEYLDYCDDFDGVGTYRREVEQDEEEGCSSKQKAVDADEICLSFKEYVEKKKRDEDFDTPLEIQGL